MPCSITTRKAMADIILTFLRSELRNPAVREQQRFDDQLRVDRTERMFFYFDILERVEKKGCVLKGVTPTKFGNTRKVKDMIDLCWKAIQKSAARTQRASTRRGGGR